MAPEGDWSGSHASDTPVIDESPDDGLSLLLLITGGYFGAVLGGVVSAWVAPQFIGYSLDRGSQSTGLLAPDSALVGAAFDIASVSFPLVFAGCIVFIDIFLVRRLVEEPTMSQRRVVGWGLFATAMLVLLFRPIVSIMPPYGLVRLLSAPVWGGVLGVGTVVITAAIAGITGLSVPIDICARSATLTAACLQALTPVSSSPIETVAPTSYLLVGWGFGGTLLVVGLGILALALGVFLLGFLLLPVAVVTWFLAALVFAAGHIRYRRQTVSNYERRH